MEKIARMNKKGSAQDILFIAITLFIFAMTILIGYKVTSVFNDNIQASSLFTAQGRTAANTLTGYFPTVIDNTFLFLTIGLCLVAVILASLVRIHPVFIALFILVMIVILILSGVFSNVYQEMAANPQLSAQADQLYFTSLIMRYLPMFILVFGTLLAIIMYKTWSNESM